MVPAPGAATPLLDGSAAKLREGHRRSSSISSHSGGEADAESARDWRARSFDVSMDHPPGSKGRYNAVGNGSGSHHGSSRHGSQAEEGGSNHGHFHKKSLSFPALVVLIFYGVSGGPFGMEEAVAAGGPLLTLLGLVLLPLAWSIPEALVTAELSTAFPEASGFVAWVSAAFGPYWGFMEGYWSWLSGVADNSLYAVLILDYVLRLLDPDSPLMEGLPRAAFLLATCALLTMLNLRGLQFVGRTAILVCVFSLLPFIIMSCWGLKGYQYPSNWLDLPAGGLQAVEWGTLLNVMFWNLNYWDSAASFAGEVDNPGRAFPRAMACCIVLVVLSGALPILAGTGVSANPDYALWEDGYFEAAATAVGGPWLGLWVVIAAAVSNVGLFEAEMSSDSMQLMGMADRGMVPKVLGRRTKSGSPLVATLLSATGVLLLGFLSFSAIVEILNSLYVFAELLEFAAFIKLRMDRPDLPRPFRVPLSTTGCIVMLLPAGLFLLLLLSVASWLTLVACGVLGAVGFALQPLLEVARRRGWCEFEEVSAEHCDF